MVEKFEGDNREWLRLLKSHALVENVGIALHNRPPSGAVVLRSTLYVRVRSQKSLTTRD